MCGRERAPAHLAAISVNVRRYTNNPDDRSLAAAMASVNRFSRRKEREAAGKRGRGENDREKADRKKQ